MSVDGPLHPGQIGAATAGRLWPPPFLDCNLPGFRCSADDEPFWLGLKSKPRRRDWPEDCFEFWWTVD
jgi:hypothetical protein